MSDFEISQGLVEAQMGATRVFADTGPENSTISLFSADDVKLATMVLAKPCGTVTDGVLRLTQAAPTGDIILVSGLAAYGIWINGGGQTLATGVVTDEEGTGPFKLGGANGTQLYAGGKVILGNTELS